MHFELEDNQTADWHHYFATCLTGLAHPPRIVTEEGTESKSGRHPRVFFELGPQA
jgi:hypothetical protein